MARVAREDLSRKKKSADLKTVELSSLRNGNKQEKQRYSQKPIENHQA